MKVDRMMHIIEDRQIDADKAKGLNDAGIEN
jgi:hypothetical protein